MMTQKKKNKKQEDEREMIVEYGNEPIDDKTIVKLINIVLNSKSKGILFLEIFILLLIIAGIIALVKYFLF